MYKEGFIRLIKKDEKLCLPDAHTLRLGHLILAHFLYMMAYM